jgi:hypothetical protein
MLVQKTMAPRRIAHQAIGGVTHHNLTSPAVGENWVVLKNLLQLL